VCAPQKRFTDSNGGHNLLAIQTLAVTQEQPHQLDFCKNAQFLVEVYQVNETTGL